MFVVLGLCLYNSCISCLMLLQEHVVDIRKHKTLVVNKRKKSESEAKDGTKIIYSHATCLLFVVITLNCYQFKM